MAGWGMSCTAKVVALAISAVMVVTAIVLGILAGVGTLSGGGGNSGVAILTQACLSSPRALCLQVTSSGAAALARRRR